jgi:tetratricopeptide (TPR) repeat protein
MGRYAEAEQALRASLALRPNTAGFSNLATLLFMAGRYSDAAAALDEAVRLNPDDYRLWYNLGAARHWAGGRAEGARQAYAQAVALAERQLEVNPRDAPLLAKLADCYAMLGRPEPARRRAEEALRAEPDNPGVLFRAGTAFEQLGDRPRALALLASAMQHGYSRSELERAPGLEDLRSDPRFGKLALSSEPRH